MASKDLLEIMQTHQGRKFIKVRHYVPIYRRYFTRFRDKPVNILEIGVYDGGSLQVWKKFFGPQARIFGLDINPKCKKVEEEQIQVFIGDQEDKGFMEELVGPLPPLDIVLDDGGHTMAQQINSFEVLYPKLAWGGVYMCEDCGTSYMPNYGGDFVKKGPSSNT